jgi:predicted membrane protein
MIFNPSYDEGLFLGFLIGVSSLIAGLFLMLFAGFLFFTIILIPFAIVAVIIGVILLIAGFFAALVRTTTHNAHHHHATSGEVKYCSVCGAPNATENRYCGNCGAKFSQSI